jgi:hypothetical protein
MKDVFPLLSPMKNENHLNEARVQCMFSIADT